MARKTYDFSNYVNLLLLLLELAKWAIGPARIEVGFYLVGAKKLGLKNGLKSESSIF